MVHLLVRGMTLVAVVSILVGLTTTAFTSAEEAPRERAPRPSERLDARPPSLVTERPFVGVSLASGFYDPGAIEDVERLVGRRPAVVQAFIAWEYTENPTWNDFPSYRVQQVLRSGIVPEIAWSPVVFGFGGVRTGLRLDDVSAGRYDTYIEEFALSAKAAGAPLLVRFAHEMNASGSPWAEGYDGNGRGDYRAAFRHVHEVFHQVGADNVLWVWAPNIRAPGTDSLERYYPGDDYVDWIGIDGYSYPRAGCDSVAEVFDATIADIRGFTDKPMMLSEVAVAEECPDKDRWIRGFSTWLADNPEILGFIWWHRVSDGRDYRLDSSSAALAAFRESW